MSNSKSAIQEIKNLMVSFGFMKEEVTLQSFKLEDETILQAEKLEVGNKIFKINEAFEKVVLENGSYKLKENFELEVSEGDIIAVKEIFLDEIKKINLIQNLNFEIIYINSIKGVNDSSSTLINDYCGFIGLKYY